MLSFYQLKVWEEETLTEEFPSLDWPVGIYVRHFLDYWLILKDPG